jgi:AAA ATPase domain
VLDSVQEALAVAALDGRTPRPVMLTGGRGVGKTVLLGAAAEIAAQQHAWLTVPIEVRAETPFRPQLIERLQAAARLYRQTPPQKRTTVTAATFRASVLGVGGEVEVSRRDRPAPVPAVPLDAALADACAAAIECDAGLLLTVDELQLAARAELGDLAATMQQHIPDNWPLVVVFAGLPSIRSTQRGVTYLERAEWHLLGLLDIEATRFALQEPARDAGRPMTDPAARRLAEASGGYPYAIQLMGHHAWRASAGSTSIDDAHATPAIRAAQDELATGLYASRWEDASGREQEYLRHLAALAASSPRVTGATVATAMRTTTKAVSVPRNRLIQKGLIYAEGEAIRFSIPGMASWVRDEEPDVTQ